ncbi:hypothetical protein CSKR_109328 [Clonorchis sinensis]|uniref:Desmoplakin SH3 domain-containing protein n=1 Tax=Clonorchis sinensis TaxID=79923 RepID=A0A8T1MR32_CLOSI|nr:hypothetical protein CSKR_109328 [Clonorchis sinensis]
MVSVSVVGRTDLDQYLLPIRAIAEEPQFRTTQKALEYEFQQQEYARDRTAWISRNILPQSLHILNDLRNIDENVLENEAALEYLMDITEMEKLYSNISAITANRAFELSMKGMEAEYSVHDMCEEVDINWDNIQKYAGIANVHLKHAADYHRFYYRTKQLNVKIQQTREEVYNVFRMQNWEHCDGVPSEASRLKNLLKKSLDEFEYYAREAENLAAQAHTIVPIYMRSQPLLTEVEGVMLCDYDVGEFSFLTGDRVVIMSNVTQSSVQNLQISSCSSDLQRTTNSEEEAGGAIREKVKHEEGPNSLENSTETIEILDLQDGPFPQFHRYHMLDTPSLQSGTNGSAPTVSPFWRIRGIGNTAEALVPAVCVWITTPDTDSTVTAARLKEELLIKWSSAIDELLQIVCNFIKQFLIRIIDKGEIKVTDGVSLTRLFNLLEDSYDVFDREEFNEEITSLLTTARTLWRPAFLDELDDAPFALRRSEIAHYISIIETLQAHMRSLTAIYPRFTTEMDSDWMENRVILETRRLVLAINTIHELANTDLYRVRHIHEELHKLRMAHWEYIQPTASTTTETDVLETTPSSTVDSSLRDTEISSTSSENQEYLYQRHLLRKETSIQQSEWEKREYLRKRLRRNQVDIQKVMDITEALKSPRERIYKTTKNIEMDEKAQRYTVVYLEVNPKEEPEKLDATTEVKVETTIPTVIIEKESQQRKTKTTAVQTTITPQKTDTMPVEKQMAHKKIETDPKQTKDASTMHEDKLKAENKQIQAVIKMETKTKRSETAGDTPQIDKTTSQKIIETEIKKPAGPLTMIQKTNYYHKTKPTKITSERTTTKHIPAMCSASAFYAETKRIAHAATQNLARAEETPIMEIYKQPAQAKLKHQYTHTTTRTVDAATQHVPTTPQTPLIEVNKRSILESKPVQKTLTTTETSIQITPNVQTNTAFAPQPTSAQTQTSKTNLIQHTTQFHKPTIATTTSERTTTKHIPAMCSASAFYAETKHIAHAATQYLARTQQTPLVELQKEHTLKAAPVPKVQQQTETLTQTTPQIITDSALTRTTNNAQSQTTQAVLVQQSVQFRKHTTDTQETHTYKTTTTMCHATSHSTYTTPTLKHQHTHTRSIMADSYSQTATPKTITTPIIESQAQRQQQTPTKKTIRMADAHSSGQYVKHVAHTPAQTPAATHIQKSVEYHKITSTDDAQTTKYTQTLCHANTNYTTPTSTVDAATQHVPTTPQTPLIEVNKRSILESKPVQKTLTTTETSIQITPNVQTNTAFAPQPTSAQTQTSKTNLIQHTTQFHKPTIATTTSERTTTKHIPPVCHTHTHYAAKIPTAEATTIHKFTTQHIPLIEVKQQQTQPTPTVTKIHANTETSMRTTPQIQTNTEYTTKPDETLTQTPTTNLVQATMQFRKPTPTTITDDAQTTKNAHITCLANTSYTITTAKLKHQYTHTTTRTVDAATQHVPTTPQTPLIEVNKRSILESKPVQKTLTTTETSIQITPNVQTNTAFAPQPTSAQTQTSKTNLIQHTTQFHKPTIATTTSERTTTKHIPAMCSASAFYAETKHIAHAATQYLARTQQTPLVELQKEHTLKAAPVPKVQQQTETLTQTTPQIITDSALTRTTNNAQSQTTQAVLVQQSVQFRKHTTDTQETHTYKTTTTMCHATSHSTYTTPTLKHQHTHTRSIMADSYSQTAFLPFVSSPIVVTGSSLSDVAPMLDVEYPGHIVIRKSFPLVCDSSSDFIFREPVFISRVCETLRPVADIPHVVGFPPVSASRAESFGYLMECCKDTTDSCTQVETQPLEFYLTELITQSSGRYISSSDLAEILSSFGFVLETKRFSQILCESTSSHRSSLEDSGTYSSKKQDTPRVHSTVCHIQTACDARGKNSREIATMFIPSAAQQAEVGIQVCLVSTETYYLSTMEDYQRNFRLGRIAETSVTVMATTSTKACQTIGWGLQSEAQYIMVNQSMQTDWWAEEVSEATTKLIYEKTKQQEITEDSSLSMDLRSEHMQEETPLQSITDYETRRTIEVESVLCQVRERTVQYQLVEGRIKDEFYWPTHIQEVASPRTGFRTPVGTAVRSGWLKPIDTEIYIDPGTNLPMRLETAEAEGLVTLNVGDQLYELGDGGGRRCLLLVERISYTWRPVRIISYTDTLNQIELSINEARLLGYIDISSDEPVILNREANTWISPEEAAGRGIIELEAIDPTEDGEVAEGTHTVRVFRITAVRPGGEPSDWLDPEDAASLGLFNWNTGEVAAEWAGRPDLPIYDWYEQSDETTRYYNTTKWCSLLTARKAGWLRLQAEVHPSEWTIPLLATDSQFTPVILATYDHLVVPNAQIMSPPPTTTQVGYEQPQYRVETLTENDEIDYIEYRKRSRRSTRKRTEESPRTRSDVHLSTITSHSLYQHYDTQIFSGQNTRRRYLSEQYLSETHVPYLVADMQDWEFDDDEQHI